MIFKIIEGYVRQGYVDGKCVSQEFVAGSVVEWEKKCSNGTLLAMRPPDEPEHEYQSLDMIQPGGMVSPSQKHKLFAVYHHHEYGSTQWLLWSEIFPTEEQVVNSLSIDFEPEKDEFIAVEEITEIQTLKLF